MNKGPIFWLSITLAFLMVVGLVMLSGGLKSHQYAITVHTICIGRNLIDMTNSPSLFDVIPEFQTDLKALLGSTTHIEKVLSGPLVGNDSHFSRLILKNDQGQALSLRLREEAGSGRFRLLSYDKVTEPAPAGNPR